MYVCVCVCVCVFLSMLHREDQSLNVTKVRASRSVPTSSGVCLRVGGGASVNRGPHKDRSLNVIGCMFPGMFLTFNFFQLCVFLFTHPDVTPP